MKNNRPTQSKTQDNRPWSIVHRQRRGVTLAELLMGLMVATIVLAAAATMADAMSNGKRQTENMTRTATYLAHLHMRLSDCVMRADSIELDSESGNGVKLTYGNGQTVRLYSPDGKSITVKDSDSEELYHFVYKQWDHGQDGNVSIQHNVLIQYDQGRVTLMFDINDNTYILTATPRGGQKL